MQQATIHHINEGQKAMPSKNGFVNLWRDINKQPWAEDAATYGVFVKLMSTVQHKPRSIEFKGVQVNLMPGEWAIDYPQIVDMFKEVKDKEHARRIIKKFKSLSQVYTKTLKNNGVHIGFVIGFNGWEKWQNCTTPQTTQETTPNTANLKVLEGGKTTQEATPQTTHINNNDLNNKKDNADPEGQPGDENLDAKRKGAFEHFWKIWRQGKNLIGVHQKPPKGETYRKNFMKAFPDSYMRKIGRNDFITEINAMCDLVEEAFTDIHSCQERGVESGFDNYKKMFPALFLTRKQWRDEA